MPFLLINCVKFLHIIYTQSYKINLISEWKRKRKYYYLVKLCQHRRGYFVGVEEEVEVGLGMGMGSPLLVLKGAMDVQGSHVNGTRQVRAFFLLTLFWHTFTTLQPKLNANSNSRYLFSLHRFHHFLLHASGDVCMVYWYRLVNSDVPQIATM